MEKKISVVINTYNAEKFLAQVIDAVKGFDEVLVCDMESTDNTVDIASSKGCKIVTFPKEGHVSAEPARTFAIQSATHPWVLVIDADEIVTPELRDYLYHIIESDDCPRGLYLPRKNFFMGKFMHCYYPDHLLRFFVKDGTVWPPYVHTMPIVQGKVEKVPASRKDLAIVHLANDSVSDTVRKTNQYTENEVHKRAAKRYGIFALLARPLFRFLKAYIIKRGFLDGKAGLVCALNQACYQFVMVAKIIENRQQKERLPDTGNS